MMDRNHFASDLQLSDDMNKQKQLKLAAFFQELAQGETAINNIKKKLTKCFCYNPSAIFYRISQGSNHITIQMMQEYTRVPFGLTERQIYELFCRFDWSRNGKISKSDFLNEIRPFKDKRLYTQNNSKLSAEVQSTFFALINEYIERWRIYEVCRQELSNIIPYQAFDSVAIYRKGFIGSDELEVFLLKNEFAINQPQLELLLDALKRKYYQNVNLEVFCENLWPIQFGYYPQFQFELKNIRQHNISILYKEQEAVIRRSRREQSQLIKSQHKHQRRINAHLSQSMQHDAQSLKLLHSQVYPRSILKSSLKSSILTSEPSTKYHHGRFASVQFAPVQFSLEQNSNRNSNLQTPYFEDRLSSNNKPNSYLLEASRRDIERQRQAAVQEQIKLGIEQQRALRKTQLQIQSRLFKDKLNVARPRTEMMESKFKAQTNLMNLAHVDIDFPKYVGLDGKVIKPDHLYLRTPQKPQFNPVPVTQKNLCYSPNYTFGAQHLVVYKKLSKYNKSKHLSPKRL